MWKDAGESFHDLNPGNGTETANELIEAWEQSTFHDLNPGNGTETILR